MTTANMLNTHLPEPIRNIKADVCKKTVSPALLDYFKLRKSNIKDEDVAGQLDKCPFSLNFNKFVQIPSSFRPFL